MAVDILILSNGPGEVTTWVRPTVQALRQQLGNDPSRVRISVVLSPCPNASGKEAAIALSYPEVNRVQKAEHFFKFLLSGKTAENWDWRDRGVVLFLGGDQIFPLAIGFHLRYRTVVYAEWEARWYRWIDRFGVMNPEVVARVPPKYAHKFTVVGDLMAEASRSPEFKVKSLVSDENTASSNSGLTDSELQTSKLIGLLPGSKPAKLAQGVPLSLAIAEHIHAALPQTRFVIPVAPTLDVETLARFADPQQNPLIQKLGFSSAKLIFPKNRTEAKDTTNESESATPVHSTEQTSARDCLLNTQHAQSAATLTPLSTHYELPLLKTSAGLCVELWTRSPAYDLLSQCSLCLTTVGANTAELGALAVPMIVLIPTQQLDAMRSWDGLPGLLANLPVVGTPLAKVINWLALRRLGLLAWPNIWAQEAVVPELVGNLQPLAVAQLALDFLRHPAKLQQMSERLRSIRGQPGAAQKLATIVNELVSSQ